MTNWFDHLKSIVNRTGEDGPDEADLARAAAVVLLDLAAADDTQDEKELAVIHEAVRQAFDLEPGVLEALIDEAHTLQAEAVSLHDYTHDLRTGLDRDARDALIGSLWQVAYADGRIHRYEEHLIRRLAGLLGVPHAEYIRRKHLAAEQAGATRR